MDRGNYRLPDFATAVGNDDYVYPLTDLILRNIIKRMISKGTQYFIANHAKLRDELGEAMKNNQ